MRELISRPEFLTLSILLKFDTTTLREMKNLIAHNAPPSKIQNYVKGSNHPLLSTILGQFALRTLNFDVAQRAFVKNQDYFGLQLVKKLATLNNSETPIQNALISIHYEEYPCAEKLFIQQSQVSFSMRGIFLSL